jgi:hypothetical protein
MKKIKYFIHCIKSSFRSRIGTNYSTKEHQYFNAWTGKVWFEKF